MNRARRFEGYAYIGPFLVLYAFILIFPLFLGIGLSLNDADLFGGRKWVGLDNYARLLADPIFWQAVANTFKLTLLIVPALTILALALGARAQPARARRGNASAASSSPPRSCR